MDESPYPVADIECGYTTGHRLFSVRHGHDLLPLQRQQEELLAFRLRLTSELVGPSVKLALNVS
jgi:hypothetical protein